MDGRPRTADGGRRERPRPSAVRRPPSAVYSGHIVLCGLDRLGLRTLEELCRLGEEVVVVASPQATFVEEARVLGVTLVEGSHRAEATLGAAGVPAARAILLVEDDDVGNLHAALAAQELNPNLRIVLRIFNQEFGQRVQALFRDCAVLTASAIAAPAFVSAALHEDWEQRLEVAGRILVLRRGSAGDPHVLLPLARLHGDGSADLFPMDGDDLLYLADGGPAAPPANQPPRQPRWSPGDAALAWRRYIHGHEIAAAARAFASDRRLLAVAATLALLVVVSALVFWLFAGLDPVDAVYFTVTIVTTTGFGDINLRDAAPMLKLYAVGLMILGAGGVAVLYALVVDAVVGVRLARALYGAPHRMRDHFVVCGLGSVGYRVVEQLARLGQPVLAAELRENARFLPVVRRMGVHVLVADTRLMETLQAANVAEARCLVVATDDEAANLETALNGLALKPGLRIVLRLFDPDLAARVERTFGIHISRSVSALAAPLFAAAAVGQRALATIPVGLRALVVALARVEPGSWAAGQTVATLEAATESRVLLTTCGGHEQWRPSAETILTPEHDLLVVATRAGLTQVLARTQAPGDRYLDGPGV